MSDLTIEQELERERQNGDRLYAALSTVLEFMRADDREDLRACLIIPQTSCLTVGHVVDGARALHEVLASTRNHG